MAYYTGSVNSYAELQGVIANACTANGWLHSNGILSKGTAFVQFAASADSAFPGLLIEGGTGQSGATLLGRSGATPRLGPGTTAAYWVAVTWPAIYHIHIGTQPDEVYVLLNTNVSNYYWLAFGVSTVTLQGTGLWLAGNVGKYGGAFGISLKESGSNNSSLYTCPAICFASTRTTSAEHMSYALQSAAGSVWPGYTSPGGDAYKPLHTRARPGWNGASPLLPIKEYETVGANRVRLITELAHARYVRVDNLEPGQVLALGSDRWKVYPFYKKNAVVPDGGDGLDHSGTFGWALRYDGA